MSRDAHFMVIAVVATAISFGSGGCGAPPTCADQIGACLDVELVGDDVGALDAVGLDVDGDVKGSTDYAVPEDLRRLPLTVPVLLPLGGGTVTVKAVAKLSGLTIALGMATIQVPPTERRKVQVRLVRVGEPTCADGYRDGAETDLDCGGPLCPRCKDGRRCLAGTDCQSKICGDDGRCTVPTCSDKEANGIETAVDCGGNCPGCADGSFCNTDNDCMSGACSNMKCVPPVCTDQRKNGGETDTDCGGANTCPRCAEGLACAAGGDCISGVCAGGKCQKPACNDNVKNGGETDIDCGGTCINNPCGDDRACIDAGDCASGVCTGGKCQKAACTDSIKNGAETDIDCGGNACARCADNKDCKLGTDCTSGICTNGKCAVPSCTDMVKNAAETDVDCGGTCGRCADGKMCKVPNDCVSSVCTANTCAAPACTDKVKNGKESDIDCGGGACPACRPGRACAVASDCAGNLCNMTGGRCALVFSVAKAVPTNFGPQQLVAGDFSGDGKPDFAVATNGYDQGMLKGAPTVAVHLGKGDGSFPTVAQYPAGSEPIYLAAGDLDGDGDLDLMVPNYYDSSVRLFIGVGNGQFVLPMPPDLKLTRYGPVGIHAADFDGDGRVDFAIAHDKDPNTDDKGFLTVLITKPNYNFALFGLPGDAGIGMWNVTSGDWNGDGNRDIAVTETTNQMRLLFGNGSGMYGGGTGKTAIGWHAGIISGDFDKDGKDDIAVAKTGSNPNFGNIVEVFRGMAGGTLSAPASHTVGLAPALLARGDFDGDGNLDIVTPDIRAQQVSLLRGRGDGTFDAAVSFPTGTAPTSVAVADWNGDGKPDLAVTNYFSHDVSILLNALP